MKVRDKGRPRASVVALASALAISPMSAAFAQDSALQTSPGSSAQAPASAASGPADEASAGGLVDIIVTARRRAESVQKVPVAVTAISSEELQARGAVTIADVTAVAPNLRITDGARGQVQAQLVLRGQSTANQTIATDPAVGIYFDEVYIARSAGAIFSALQDMESVEVLRGNQGTLFGRNSTGGAILLTPKRPDLNDMEGSVQASYGNYDAVSVGGILSVPLVEGKLGVRGSFQRTTRDSIGRSISTGIDRYGNQRRFSSRIAARWAPIDDLTFDLTYDYSRVNEGGRIAIRDTDPLLPRLGFYETSSTEPDPMSYAKVQGIAFRTNYEVSPAAQIKAIFAYRKMRFANTTDVDGSALVSIDSFLGGRQDQFTAELQVAGDIDVSADWLTRVSYVAGFYYFTEDGDENTATPYQLAVPRRQVIEGENSSVAGFAQLEAYFTDDFSIYAGLRKTRDSKHLITKQFAAGTGLCSLTGNPVNCEFRGDASFNFYSWNTGARYAITDDINVYIRASRGQRSGGLDDTPTSIASFEPEILQDYEFGLKANFLDRRLRTNIAVFTGDYDNIQRSFTIADPFGVPYTSVINAAKGRVRGVEAEVTLQPVQILRLSGSLGYTDAEYKRFINPTTLVDASGNRFYQVPKWTYSLSGDLSVPTSAGKFSARVDYSYRSKVYFEVFNSERTKQDGFGLLNGRISFAPEFALGSFEPEITLFGKNLTDKNYNSDGISTPLGASLFRAMNPRTYGVELRATF